MVQNLPDTAGHSGDTVRSLGQEDSLEEELATYSSVLAWIQSRGAWEATVHAVAKSQTQLSTHTRQRCHLVFVSFCLTSLCMIIFRFTNSEYSLEGPMLKLR